MWFDHFDLATCKCVVFSHHGEAAEMSALAIVWQVLMCMHSFVLLCWLNEWSTHQLEQMCVFMWTRKTTKPPRFFLHWHMTQYMLVIDTGCLGNKSKNPKWTQRKQVCINAKHLPHNELTVALYISSVFNTILNLIGCVHVYIYMCARVLKLDGCL